MYVIVSGPCTCVARKALTEALAGVVKEGAGREDGLGDTHKRGVDWGD